MNRKTFKSKHARS